jgi:hypothetical protein
MAVKLRLCSAREPRPILRAFPGGGARADEAPSATTEPSPSRPVPVKPEVVAEVLSDGTIRQVGEEPRPAAEDFETGRISGDGWILWWERRRLGD